MTSRRKKTSRAVASQRIVVDANVLRGASSTDGGPPAGQACRSALQSILDICHRAVVSPALLREYQHHESSFGQRWRSAMERRKQIVRTPAAETGRSRGWMQSAAFTPKQRDAAAKDLHLVLAAREQGGVILSADDTARALFARLDHLQELGWARMNRDDVEGWLARGAPADEVMIGR